MVFSCNISELEDDSELESAVDGYGEDAGHDLQYNDVDFDSLGIDPYKPTNAKPGSEEKVLMLAARHAAGIALWNEHDCQDHGKWSAMDEAAVKGGVNG